MDRILLESSPFHNPRLNLSDKNKEQKIYELVKEFVLPISKLRKIMEIHTKEMNLGLVDNSPRKSLFFMCNTFVTEIPDGTEEGDFLGFDLSGVNLRIHLARLKPEAEPEFRTRTYYIDVKYRTGTTDELFDFLADCLKDFINRNPDIEGKRLPMGFTFSFGYDQKALDEGIITNMSDAINLSDAIGKDAVQCFREAIKRKGLNIDLLAILNDTTSTLAYGMYLKRDTHIGFILGAGTNTCYNERVGRIETLSPIQTFGKKVENVIINCENGFLGDDGAIDFATTTFDLEIDEESTFPNTYAFEKLISGVYIGELVRRVLLCLAENNVFLKQRIPINTGIITKQLKQKDSIRGADISSVESTTIDGPVITLLRRLGYSASQISKDDIAIVQYVCALVSVRTALLAVTGIASVVEHIGKPFVRVAVDGTLYKKHPKLHKLMSDFITELIPNKKVELFLADDGSGKGSAFIAAVVDKNK